MKRELHLAGRYLFRGKARHISFIGVAACLGVSIGIAALIIAFSLVNGIDGGLVERIMRFKAHLTVDALDEKDLSAIKDEVNTWPEVKAAYLNINTQVFAKFGDSIMPLVVKGFNFDEPGAKKVFEPYISQEYSQEGFFIGEGISRRYLLDDKIEFYPLKRQLRLTEEPIRGTFKVGLYDIDNFYIIGDFARVKELSPNYTVLLGIKIEDPYRPDEIKRRIEEKFPQGIFVTTWIQANRAIFSVLKLQKLGLFIVLGLIVIVSSFNIFSTLTIKVVEKVKDIGILRSLGFSARSIRLIFTFQGLIIGGIGVILGSALGISACLALKKYPFIRVPEEIFGTAFLPVVMNMTDIVVIIVSGLLITFSCSILPAYRAARLSPTQALRYE